MTYLPPSSALIAYRAGRHDEAMTTAGAMIDFDPLAGEAHLCRALIHLRRNQAGEAVAAMRRAIAARSAAWALGQLRADFTRVGRPPMTRDMAVGLGGVFRTALGPLGPVLEPQVRRAGHPYANIVGTSYVRSFGANPAFFPLFIGMGPSTLMLTDDAAAITRRKTEENLRRLDTTRDTILILSSDAYYHATNLLKTRASSSEQATPDDDEVMDRTAERHEGLLSAARKIISGRLFLVGSMPTQSDLMGQFARRLNLGLRQACERTDVAFLDWWDVLAEPTTQRLNPAYCVDAYPGDVHFTTDTTALIIDLLKDQGVFDDRVASTATFDWTHVFECEVNAGERTRIWCEPSITPNNAIKSNKIASSHLAQRAADLLTGLTLIAPDQPVAMVNVRDAFLPTLIPMIAQSGCVALTDTVDNHQVGQMTLDFYGRSDVVLRRFSETDLPGLLSGDFSILVLCIHPDTTEPDEARCNAALRTVGAAETVAIMTPYPERLDRLVLGDRKIVNTYSITNRHLPEMWRTYMMAIAR